MATPCDTADCNVSDCLASRPVMSSLDIWVSEWIEVGVRKSSSFRSLVEAASSIEPTVSSCGSLNMSRSAEPHMIWGLKEDWDMRIGSFSGSWSNNFNGSPDSFAPSPGWTRDIRGGGAMRGIPLQQQAL